MSKPYIELYIDDKKVEFKEPPRVLITYSHQDLHNPTIVKNSFSKTINIEGTPHNNQIFGNFYDMSRISGYDDISMSGAYFNASKKVPFELYRNGEMMEQGYIKLDKVKKKGNNIQYDITLYGGLGEFLYNLQTKDDGEQMKLSDLDFGGGDNEFNFEVNKTNVLYAWNRVNKYQADKNPVWMGDDYKIFDSINFAPCYNGIPSDFSSDKVAIDVESFNVADGFDLYNQFKTSIKDGDTTYKTVDGWLLGELNKEYDEWQTQDLRSYLQRPIIRFKNIINACCNPENNGGYTVDLDKDFFNEENPYYDNAWMTLPLLSEIEMNVSEDDVEIDVDENGIIRLNGLTSGDMFSTSLRYFLASNANVELQSNGYGYTLNTGAFTYDKKTTLISANMAIYSQLVVYDKYGNAVGGSNVISCSRKYGDIPTDFVYDLEYNAPVTFVNGSFRYEGVDEYRYRFWDNIELGEYMGGDKPKFTLDLSNIKYADGMYLKFVTKIATIDNGTVLGYAGKLFWSEGYEEYPTESNIVEHWGMGDISKTFNQKYITKKHLLNSENTPCDYFLSFIKMFNLHIWKDMYDKVIYIRLRKNFFKDERYDLDDIIDRGKDITITPLTYENKWLNFNLEMEENKLSKDYVDEYGIKYGIQKVDTNYNFDSSSKDLFDKSVFSGAIQSRNKSKYYINVIHRMSDEEITYPSYFLDGVQTLLFNGEGDTTEGSYITPKTGELSQYWWGDKYYDLMPKPLFIDDENSPVNGANVLLFYSGKVESVSEGGEWINYYLTDDIPQFEKLNEGEPCWIWTYNTTLASRPEYLPVFSRYLVNENNWVTHSWDFGTPKSLYIPDYSIDDTSNIYTQYWRPYIKDMYNVDTRIVECNVLLKERVVGDWLRRFYYWDGTYFILNKISDYDVTSNDTTKCELVRVQDINNYLI